MVVDLERACARLSAWGLIEVPTGRITVQVRVASTVLVFQPSHAVKRLSKVDTAVAGCCRDISSYNKVWKETRRVEQLAQALSRS